MSFRIKLFALLAGLTAVLTVVSMGLVNYQFRRNTDVRVRREIAGAHLRFDRFQRSKMVRLIADAANISEDPRLRGSLSTGDRATIQQAAEDTWQGYRPDLFWILNLDGEWLAVIGSHPAATENMMDHTAIHDAMNGYDSGDLWYFGDKFYQLAAVPIVSGGTRLGILVLGWKFNHWLTDEFHDLSGLDVAFVSGTELRATSLQEDSRDELGGYVAQSSGAWQGEPLPSIPATAADSAMAAPFMEFQLQPAHGVTAHYAGARFGLKGAAGETLGLGIVFRSLEPERLLLSGIQLGLLLVGGVTVFSSLLIAYILARNLSRPINRLVESSERLGRGDLDQPILPTTRDEIGTLAHALDEMRTSLKNAREELIRSERLSTIGRMASGIIHDFRQPMSCVYGYVDLLSLPETKEGSRANIRENLYLQMDRMVGMINELLDFARGEIRLNPSVVRLSEFLAGVQRAFDADLKSKEVTLEMRMDWDGEMVIDIGRMQRGVENIIRNAVQALPQRGRITIGTSAIDGTASIAISDNGPGIPADVLPHLFEPFFTYGKSQGTGLGLAVAQKVVQEHGGELTVTSTLGEGATFNIRLPQRGGLQVSTQRSG